jgi:hypothetical protein
MKRYAVLVLCLAALAVSCASTAETPASSGAGQGELPPWINELPPEDVLWGIGAAKQSTENFSMDLAEARGRQSIARQLDTLARGMITDFARDAGSGASQSSVQLAEAVTRQLTEARLVGASPIKRWKGPDGTWWFLVQYSKSEAAKATADLVDTEAARYAEFKALEALKLMNAELTALKEKPVPVTE